MTTFWLAVLGLLIFTAVGLAVLALSFRHDRLLGSLDDDHDLPLDYVIREHTEPRP